MEHNIDTNINLDLNKSIEKAIKKYTLEVDDAIEAHGFKATSCIDYAEDVISELEHSIKQHFESTSSDLLFKNLENSLNHTVQNIINYTKEDAIYRKHHSFDKIDKKTNELHSALSTLNTRFLNSLEMI